MQRASGRKAYLEQASSTYHAQLRSLDASLRAGVVGYLTSHSVMDWEIIDKYQLGFVADPLPGDQRFTGMLSIPFLSRNGVTALRFRNFSRQGTKYAQASGQTNRLYNTLAFHGEPSNTIGITEGEIDAIVATEKLGLPSIGITGSKAWNSQLWRPLFRDFQTVVIFADGDTADNEFAGQEFAKRISEDLGWRALIAQCPTGHDVSSMVTAGRGDELKALYSTSNQENSK